MKKNYRSKYNLYLDMDGVCVDWLKSALTVLGREDLIDNMPRGVSNISEATGINMKEIWEIIQENGSDWWRNLPELPWFRELYESLDRIGPVTILTAPSRDPNCAKGKIQWLRDKFGKEFRDFIITSHKYHCAGPNKILIDDTLSKCQNFINSGGKAVLFPTDFNDLLWQFKENKNINQANLLTYVIERVVDNTKE